MSWTSLTDFKIDLGIDDTRDDAVLLEMLDAAVSFVEMVRPDFAYDGVGPLPPVPQRIVTGTYRLAGRWYTRRRSPDGLVSMAELGAARVPSFDSDIERMLGIGRYRSPVIA